MINISLTKDYCNDIVSLWNEAFGDSEEEIKYFLNNCINKSCLELKNDGKLCSMLFLVDAVIKGKNYKYIYVASTFEKYKKMGYMTKLLEYCKNDIGNVILIPADEKLVDFYTKRGFNHKVEISSILFNESSEIKEFLLEGCTLKEPFALAYSVGE